MNWSEVKSKMESLLSSDPQRATLALRAIRSVEEGLAFIAQQGYRFELAERGALGELRAALAESNSRTMSIAEAADMVQPALVEGSGSEVFDA